MPLIAPPQSVDPYRNERRIESWSRYWASGALHSCAGSFDGNYAGSLRAFWNEVFSSLPPAVLAKLVVEVALQPAGLVVDELTVHPLGQAEF